MVVPGCGKAKNGRPEFFDAMVTAMFEQVGSSGWVWFSLRGRLSKPGRVASAARLVKVCGMDPELPAEVIDAVFKAG